MAGDWIKMRVALRRDPKVASIADYLASDREFMRWIADPLRRSCQESAYECVTSNVTRCVTVTALLEIWGMARDRGDREDDDLILRHCQLSNLDDVCDTPCIGEAMAFVGWAEEFTEESQGRTVYCVRFPKFFKKEEPPGDRHKENNRKRQEKHRQKQRYSNVTSNVTDNAEITHREEKRREEKNNTNTPLPPLLDVPEFVKAWDDWKAYRSEIRKALKPSTQKKQLKLFASWGVKKSVAVIELSITNGWQGLFPDKVDATLPPRVARILTDEEMATGTYNPTTGWHPGKPEK